jgi:hypothetical protein
MTFSLILTLALVSCGDSAGGGGTGGGGDTLPITYDGTFTTTAAFKTWLDEQSGNTAATPYNVKLNIAALDGNYETAGSLGNALYTNDTKYVNLDLSGSTLTSIGEKAFYQCTSLTGITIPGSVTTIESQVFDGCTSLTAINVDPANSAYTSENGVLYNKAKTTLVVYPAGKTGSTFTIPASVTSIGDGAFNSCTSLTSITILNVTSIGDGAFWHCTSLASVTIGSGVTSIRDSAFWSCTSLTSVTIGSGVTSIGQAAFQSCTSLTGITIPNTVTSIGQYAFNNCPSLVRVIFQGTITPTNFSSSYAFNGDLRDKYLAGAGGVGTYTRTAGGDTWTKSS